MFKFFIMSTVLVGIIGCAGSGSREGRLIVGQNDARYTQNLASCQTIALSREYVNSDNRTDALIDVAFNNDVAEGAIESTLIAGGAAALVVVEARQEIIRKCMSIRGYKVLN